MKADCIANQLSQWEKITLGPEILSTVSGLPLDFSEKINYKSSVTPSKFSPKEEMFLSVEINNLLHLKELLRSVNMKKVNIFPQFS